MLKNKKVKWLILVGVLAALVIALLPAGCAPAEEEEGELPEVINLAGGPSFWASTRAFNLAGTAAIEKITGMKVTIEGMAEDTPRFLAVKYKHAEIAYSSVTGFWTAATNQVPWKSNGLGPQRIRLVTAGGGMDTTPLATKTSGITTLAGMKGSRVVYASGSPGTIRRLEAIFAAEGFTWDDVVKVPMPSTSAAYSALAEGTADIFMGGASSASTLKAAASPAGVTLLALPDPAVDPEWWKRAWEVDPTLIVIKQKAELFGGKELISTGFKNGYGTYPWLPDAVAYAWVKGFVEGYEEFFKPVSTQAARYTLESQLDPPPLVTHPGAIKYFKEIGVWSAELEANNQEMIRQEDERMAPK